MIRLILMTLLPLIHHLNRLTTLSLTALTYISKLLADRGDCKMGEEKEITGREEK